MTSLLRRRMVVAIAALLLVAAARAQDGSLSPGPVNAAKNIARMNCGAQLEWKLADGSSGGSTDKKLRAPAVLIMDDNTVSCALPEGDSTFIVTLPQKATLDRFSFVNENATAQGELRLAVSNANLTANSDRWTEIEGRLPFTRKRLFNLSLLGVEAKYLRVTFHVEKAGRIAGLGLFGIEKMSNFAEDQDRFATPVSNGLQATKLVDKLNFDFANSYSRAKVVYVSSGRPELAQRMIDDDPATQFAFSPDDPQPTVIVQLAKTANLDRASALYQNIGGELEVFLLNELRSNPGDLSGFKPVAQVNDRTGAGKAAIGFDPRGARYIAFRWHVPGAKGFEVAEVHAFGNVSLSRLIAWREARNPYNAGNEIDEMLGSYRMASNAEMNSFEVPQIPVVSR